MNEPISPLKIIPYSKRSRPTKEDIIAGSFVAVKALLPDEFPCIICNNVFGNESQILCAGLVGRFTDNTVFVYIIHTDCALSNLDIIRTVENKTGGCDAT